MSLHSISVMVIAPLVLVVGAVLILTPRDILRQPVLPTANDEPRPVYTAPAARHAPIAVVEFETPTIQPASLIVVASAPEPPSGREVVVERQPAADLRWITARGLNVRTGPTVRASLIASLPYGTAVEVLEISGTWAHVRAGEITGWLSTNFLTDEEPTAN